MKLLKLKYVCVLAILSLNSSLFSQDDSTNVVISDSIAESKKYKIDEITVSSIRSDGNMKTTQTTLNKDYLRNFNIVQDAPYVFQSTPSLSFSSDAGNGIGYTYLSLRGIDQERIQVSINGVPYNDAESFQVYWVDIPDILSNTESVQIQRGIGYSTLGGIGLGGNISIKTTRRHKKPYLRWTTNMGSFNTYKNIIEMTSGDVGKGWQIYARGTKLNSDGYIDRAKSDIISFFIDLSKYGEKYTGHLQMSYGAENTYQAWYGLSQADLDARKFRKNIAGTDYEQKKGEPYDNQIDDYTQTNIQFINNIYWNSKNKSSATLYSTLGDGYYEEYKVNQLYSSYSDSLSGMGDLIRQLCLSNNLYGLNLSHVFDNGKIENISAAAVNFYRGNHFGKLPTLLSDFTGTIPERYYDNDASKIDFTVFDKINLKTGKSVFTIDGQFRLVKYDGTGTQAGDSLNFAKMYYFVNPKIGWNITNPKIGDFYTFLGFAFKEPNRNDILAVDSNYMPEPERVVNLELGYHWKNDKVSILPNLYGMYYLSQLVPTGNLNSVGAPIRENVENSFRAGVELAISYKPVKFLKLETNQSVSLNKILDYNYYQIAYNSDNSINENYTKVINYKFTDIANSPTWVSYAAVTLTLWKNAYLQLNNKVVSKQYLDNTSSNNKSIPMYTYTNFYGTYKFLPKFCKELSLHVYLNNIFGSHLQTRGYTYYSGDIVSGGTVTPGRDLNFYYPQSGINFMFGGTLLFE